MIPVVVISYFAYQLIEKTLAAQGDGLLLSCIFILTGPLLLFSDLPGLQLDLRCRVISIPPWHPTFRLQPPSVCTLGPWYLLRSHLISEEHRLSAEEPSCPKAFQQFSSISVGMVLSP